jgi:hypothetical protein
MADSAVGRRGAGVLRSHSAIAFAAMCVLGATAACSSTPLRTSPTVSVSPVTSSTRREIDRSDPRPVLAFGYWNYAHPDYYQPKDLQTVYVYPDGTVIRVMLDGNGTNDRSRLVSETFTIAESRVDALLALADEARLNGGGMQPFLPLPEGRQVQDGGSAVFLERNNDVETARVIDQLSQEEDEPPGGERVSFARLFSAVAALLCCETYPDLVRAEFNRWAIVSAPALGNQPYPEQTWSGPDLASLSWVDIGNDSKCVVIDRQSWTLPLSERREPQIIIDDRIITRRPLLPHETDCTAVARTRQLLDL